MDRQARALLQALTAATLKLRECQSKQDVQTFFGDRSKERARRYKTWLARHEAQFQTVIARGDHVDPSSIEPTLHPVTTREERELFRFARFTSSLPFSDRVGRRLRFLIRDASLPNRPLMGIAALGSPVLDLRSRDKWVFGGAPSRRRNRQRRLASLAELYVAVGLRPYSDLLAGKLICYCMATREIVDTYNRSYSRRRGMPLALIYTISAYGSHSSQYNRISMRGRLLYRQIGVTEGWSISHFPDRLVDRISEFLETRRIRMSNALPRKHPSKFHIVHRFLRKVGVRPERVLYTGIRRAVYVCPLAKNFDKVVQASVEPQYDLPSLEEAIQWWRSRWLAMRSANLEVMQRVREFRPETTYTVKALCGPK